MSAPTIVFTVVLAIVTLSIPRKWFLLPFIVAACFIPADQRVIIMGLDFTPLRMLVVFGFLRVFMRGEAASFKLNYFDKLILIWSVCSAFIYVLNRANTEALINRSGFLFDVVGLYWLFRLNISSWKDIKRIARIFAVCALVMAVFVAKEWTTGDNPFKYLGVVNTSVREGRYRCQAAFPHSIMMGLFWATLVPLFIGVAKSESGRKVFWWSAVAACTFMVLASASSTPLGGLASAFFFIAVFKYRRYGKKAAWGIIATLCALHIVMRAPVWHLISRIDIVGGSTGYHRYKLIDNAISHFNEWVLFGTRDTAHWGWGMGDVTNQYIAEGVKGGLLGLVLFVTVLVVAVKSSGKYSLLVPSRKQQWLAWGICAAVLSHCVSFFGVTYFGQIRMLLFLMFAISGWIYQLLDSEQSALTNLQMKNKKKVANASFSCHT